MSYNDCVVLDAILKEFRAGEGLEIGQRFEQFAIQQVLKDYALTPSQLEDGYVDAGWDGGIDGFYVLVNGNPYESGCGFQWPREDVRITVWIITCKHGGGFQNAPLESLYATLSEFWDLGKTERDFREKYSQTLLRARRRFLEAYTTLAHCDPLVEIRLVYASRGDAASVSAEPQGRMRQLEEQAKSYFSKSKVKGEFVGARELLILNRKSRDESLVLPFVSSLAHDGNNYVVIAKLGDYYGFVKNGEGKLRRYLFDSNVRAFLGYNSVNEDIDNTLRNPNGVNFWWLNNGITILADNAKIVGRQLHLKGVQIVNGLQTTETLYRHFASGRAESLDSEILIKVLTLKDADVRYRILQATNNQSDVASFSLHATDEIQRNIEAILNSAGLHYERLEHDPRNEGIPASRIIQPIELAKAYLAVVYRNPAAAARLQIKFTRNPILYNELFPRSFPVDRWPLLATVWRTAERVYFKKIGRNHYPPRHCKRWLPLVVYCVVAKAAGKFDFNIKDLSSIEWSGNKSGTIVEIWNLIVPHFDEYPAMSRAKLADPKAAYDDMLQKIARHTGLKGVECANKRNLYAYSKDAPVVIRDGYMLSESFLENLQNTLPPQPWPVGVHRTVAESMGVRDSLVHAAIKELIVRGRLNRQIDGIVYNPSGFAIAVDPQRCNKTLEEINANGPCIWE